MYLLTSVDIQIFTRSEEKIRFEKSIICEHLLCIKSRKYLIYNDTQKFTLNKYRYTSY